jgi:hypothetical protein
MSDIKSIAKLAIAIASTKSNYIVIEEMKYYQISWQILLVHYAKIWRNSKVLNCKSKCIISQNTCLTSSPLQNLPSPSLVLVQNPIIVIEEMKYYQIWQILLVHYGKIWRNSKVLNCKSKCIISQKKPKTAQEANTNNELFYSLHTAMQRKSPKYDMHSKTS